MVNGDKRYQLPWQWDKNPPGKQRVKSFQGTPCLLHSRDFGNARRHRTESSNFTQDRGGVKKWLAVALKPRRSKEIEGDAAWSPGPGIRGWLAT